jgi:hypothetical protein
MELGLERGAGVFVVSYQPNPSSVAALISQKNYKKDSCLGRFFLVNGQKSTVKVTIFFAADPAN